MPQKHTLIIKGSCNYFNMVKLTNQQIIESERPKLNIIAFILPFVIGSKNTDAKNTKPIFPTISAIFAIFFSLIVIIIMQFAFS